MTPLHLNRNCLDCATCTNRSPLFDPLSKNELALMNKDRYSIKFNKGEIIFKQGTIGTKVISLVDGLAKIYLECYNNKNLLLSIVKPKVLIGGPGIHTDNRNHYSVSALTNTTVCFIDTNNFNEVLRNNNKFSELVIKHLSLRTIINFDKIVSLTQKQMHGRMADALLYLSENIFERKSFDMVISRQDLADLSAMSKDSAIRILKEFKYEHIISVERNEIKISDINKLKNISITC